MNSRNGYNRALVAINTEKGLARGIVLPSGVELVDRAPQYDPTRGAWLFVVEGRDLPYTEEYGQLPVLQCLRGYDVPVVEVPQ